MWTRAQLSFAAIASGWLVAHLTVRHWGWPYLFVLLLVAILLGAVFAGLIRLLGAAQELDARVRGSKRANEQVRSLTFSDARERALLMLDDSGLFRCSAAPPTDADGQLFQLLPESVRDLFGRYERIEERYGDGRIDRRGVARTGHEGRFLKIGAGTAHSKLLVEPGKDTVYEKDDDEPEQDLESWPSIYHWIVAEGSLMKRASTPGDSVAKE